MGVCDGHGMFGQDVSGYLVNTLPQNMNINLINLNISNLSMESSIKIFPVILSTFVATNIDMTEDDRVDSTYSGSTCVSLFYTPNTISISCINIMKEKFNLVDINLNHIISLSEYKIDLNELNECYLILKKLFNKL